MSSSGDEFFLLDDNHNWWNDIPDPKYLMMLPNAEHTMAPHYLQIYQTMVSFILHVLENKPMPSVTWTTSSDESVGRINLKADPAPHNITAYYAHTWANVTRRDFRLAALREDGSVSPQLVFWRHNIPVEELGNGEYTIEMPATPGVWTGFFIEGEWEGPNGYAMTLTSQVNIVPNTFPRPKCTDTESCHGWLT